MPQNKNSDTGKAAAEDDAASASTSAAGEPRKATAAAAAGSASPTTPACAQASHSQDSDLFSFLSAMHLSGAGPAATTLAASSSAAPAPAPGPAGAIVAGGSSSCGSAGSAGLASNAPAAAVQLVSSRKRKLLEQGLSGHGELLSGKGHKWNSSGSGASGNTGGVRAALLRRNSDDLHDDSSAALHTPQCSQSGYADEEHDVSAAAAAVAARQRKASMSGVCGTSLFSPVNAQLMSEIDLAANFDDSLSGLGVDITTASMSEALLANLPNLSISSSQCHYFKQEMLKLKEEPGTPNQAETISSVATHKKPAAGLASRGQNFGALDLSNDEAHLPESTNSSEAAGVVVGPKTFTGSVSREGSRGATPVDTPRTTPHLSDRKVSVRAGTNESSPAPAAPGQRAGGPRTKPSDALGAAVSDPSAAAVAKAKEPVSNPDSKGATACKAVAAAVGGSSTSKGERSYERLNEATTTDVNKFQYILVASTSIATKINEPSITYLNQGQSYELRLKKLGDLSAHRKKLLRCVIRICFHERRLQYMETEQIAEWRNSHPGERILDFDLPLSYGVIEPTQEQGLLNVLSFKWDPTRDTGIYIKVNCISTEFTPKKHGGEKGVPFRLQVETLDPTSEDVRLHAAGCVLQVFKLKGADRKHKQDRDKISKRPQSEQVKYAPSYECTVLNDLSIENIYVPPNAAESTSPPALESPNPGISRDGSPGHLVKNASNSDIHGSSGSIHAGFNETVVQNLLPLNAPVELVTQWLSRRRYGKHVSTFRNYNGRDMLRLAREELITLCGLSDGIRLYNDLHMAQVAPRTTFYVAQKDSMEYSALFLEDGTVNDLLTKLAQSIEVDASVFGKVFILGPQSILVRVTDSVIHFTKPESIFQFSLRQSEAGDTCDVLLEEMTPMIDTSVHINHQHQSNHGQEQQHHHHHMTPGDLGNPANTASVAAVNVASETHSTFHPPMVASVQSQAVPLMQPPPPPPPPPHSDSQQPQAHARNRQE